MKTHIASEQSMIDFGRELASSLNGGDILLLEGDLGAGKTTLTKGIAQGLGISDDIVSPTFTLMNMYDVRNSKDTKLKKMIHIDTYRLEDEDQLLEIGVEDYMGQVDTIMIIEWPEKLKTLLHGKKVTRIVIEHVDDGRDVIVMKQ